MTAASNQSINNPIASAMAGASSESPMSGGQFLLVVRPLSRQLCEARKRL